MWQEDEVRRLVFNWWKEPGQDEDREQKHVECIYMYQMHLNKDVAELLNKFFLLRIVNKK